MSSNEELEIPDFDHDLSDSECESMKENDKMHKIESPTKKGTICLQLYDSIFSSSDPDSEISDEDENCNENCDYKRQSEKLDRGSKMSIEAEVSKNIQRYAKKPKWSSSISNNMNKMNLNDLTREELVAIITDNRNVIQNLQQKCDEFEIHIDKWKQKSKMMQKMQQDLNDVVKRYVNDVETKSPSKPVTIARSVGVQVQTEDKIKGRIGILTLQNHKIGDDFFVKPISQKLPSEKMITNEEMNEKIQNFEIDLNIEKDYSGDLKRICEDKEKKICGNSSTNSMVSPPKKSNFLHDLDDLSDISSEEFELELDKKSSEELSSGKRFKCFNTPKRKKKKQVNKVVAKSKDTPWGRRKNMTPRIPSRSIPLPNGTFKGDKNRVVCDLCGKSFSKRKNLNAHCKIIHEKIKNHKCETCGKEFSRAIGLKDHVNSIHDGISIYKCELCKKSFQNHSNLNRHKCG